MRVLLAALTLALGFGSPVRAEPLDPSHVSADAKWLAHVDFDVVRASKLAQRAHEELLSRDPAKQKLEALRKTLGLDLMRDLRSLTFYGSRFLPGSGVAIVRAKMDRQRLLGLVRRDPSHRTSPYGKHELHSWTQAKGKPDEHTVTGCFHQATVLVLGRNADEVKAALDVLDGKSPCLAGSDAPLGAEAPAGSIFAARAVGLADADLPFKSPIVRQVESLSITLGEHEGEVFGEARLVASTPEVAENVQSAVEGLRAIAQLQHAADQDRMKALRALQVTMDEKTVTLRWRMSVDALLKLIEKEWAKLRKPKEAD